MKAGPIWAALRKITPSRIGLERTGAAMITTDVLAFDMACARAKDAVFQPLAEQAILDALAPLPCIPVRSRATSREAYLRNPGLGRQLHPDDVGKLPAPAGYDLVLVIADGLSADAARDHAPALVKALRHRLTGLSLGPIIVAHQGRVALGDEIGERMRARAVAVLLGERPGLSTPTSLGLYLTIAPMQGRRDADRNCISNIHDHGMPPEVAARKLDWLLREGLRLGIGGVALKDREAEAIIDQRKED